MKFFRARERKLLLLGRVSELVGWFVGGRSLGVIVVVIDDVISIVAAAAPLKGGQRAHPHTPALVDHTFSVLASRGGTQLERRLLRHRVRAVADRAAE
ncbi:hypothetical protein PFISCL1PPCAC_28953, partial [Pristionchus fissidentatus]